MRNVAAPLSFRRGHRGFDFGFTGVERPRPVGRLRKVLISQVRAELSADSAREGRAMSVAGLPGHPVEYLTLDGVDITFPGDGTRTEAGRSEIPERAAAYPEHDMFGVLPASGLWIRHAAGLTLRGLRFDLAAADARPGLVRDDVDDLAITDLHAHVVGGEPLVRLHQVRGAVLQQCRPRSETEVFLLVEGELSADIALSSNDLRRVRHPTTTDGSFRGDVTETNNLERM